jgi:hypothetical protein
VHNSLRHVHAAFSRMRGRLAGLVKLLSGRRQVFPGFHNDGYLLALVDVLAPECTMFIETGSAVGETLSYVARRYPHLTCLSCEPDRRAYRHALRNTAALQNVRLYNQTSQQLIERISTEYAPAIPQRVLCWLDAHGRGFAWPLRQEVAFVTNHFSSAYILIDDCRVPARDWFGYDTYDGQECSLEYIRDSLNPALDYGIYYPTYKERTSQHHPLRGWMLLAYGARRDLSLPPPLRRHIQREKGVPRRTIAAGERREP